MRNENVAALLKPVAVSPLDAYSIQYASPIDGNSIAPYKPLQSDTTDHIYVPVGESDWELLLDPASDWELDYER